MKRVFISYSQDSDEHVDWVRNLADTLTEKHIEVALDKYVEETPPPNWPGWLQWGEECLRPDRSDAVLMICTATYKYRVTHPNDPVNQGKGSCWEARIIYNYLFNSNATGRFLQIIPPNGTAEDIPITVQHHQRFQLTARLETTDRGFQNLVKYLGGEEHPPIQPPEIKLPKRVKPSDAIWSDEAQRKIQEQLEDLFEAVRRPEVITNVDGRKVGEVLALLNVLVHAGKEPATDYRKNLLELSRKVIDLRTEFRGFAHLLRVPAYDLLLPFKAGCAAAENAVGQGN